MEQRLRKLSAERRLSEPSASHVDRVKFSCNNMSDVLTRSLVQHNEASKGRGLKYLRSFLNNIVSVPSYSAAKPILDSVCGPRPVDCLPLARALVSQQYDTHEEQFVASQIAFSVLKYPFDGLPQVARANGLRVFLKGERRNRHMNALFRARRRKGLVSPHMLYVKDYVRRVLGERPNFHSWVQYAGWGPGSCIGVSGTFTNFCRKLLAEEWTVTPSCIPYALSIARRLPMFWEVLGLRHDYPGTDPLVQGIINVDHDLFEARFLARCKIVSSNALAFVRKEADKDRVIASEPLLNQFVQMAADNDIRLRLRRFGIDLRDQGVNQVWAREGSLGGSNPRCTIDLKNASGSIFIELVRECCQFCPDWFVALNAIRSPSYSSPDDTHLSVKRYEMFSSMGNGFTFPLETLIFAAICSAAHRYCGTQEDFRCYGDDLVVRQNESLVVLEILRDCGFVANADKTFLFGPFRESCGTDWYNGIAVRPIVLDNALETFEQRVRLHNAFTRLPNVRDAAQLSSACVNWFPTSFSSWFVRPYADHTDEAIDGRFLHGPPGPPVLQCLNTLAPGWYGLAFSPVLDRAAERHDMFYMAYHYAGLLGAISTEPFAARRETILRVARFSHSGNTSSWLPHEPDAHSDGRARPIAMLVQHLRRLSVLR